MVSAKKIYVGLCEHLKCPQSFPARFSLNSLETAAEAKKKTTRKAAINAAIEAQKIVDLSRQLLELAHKKIR